METTDYCDYKLSLALKACGFDEPCEYYYTSKGRRVFNKNKPPYANNRFLDEIGNEICSAVPLWHAQKWLREKKGIAINVDAHNGDFYTWEAVFLSNAAQDVVIEASLSAKFSPYVEKHDSYECALSAGIAVALELIKKGE